MIMYKSLSELYSELCIKLRAIAVAEAGGETACVWCRSRKNGEHDRNDWCVLVERTDGAIMDGRR